MLSISCITDLSGNPFVAFVSECPSYFSLPSHSSSDLVSPLHSANPVNVGENRICQFKNVLYIESKSIIVKLDLCFVKEKTMKFRVIVS